MDQGYTTMHGQPIIKTYQRVGRNLHPSLSQYKDITDIEKSPETDGKR